SAGRRACAGDCPGRGAAAGRSDRMPAPARAGRAREAAGEGRMGSNRRIGKRRRLGGALAVALLPAAPAGSPSSAQPADAPPSEGRLLVLNKKDATLQILDVPSYETLATIPVGREPHEVAVTPDGKKAYVSNVGDRSVSVVDLGARRVARSIRADRLDVPHGLAVTPDGRSLLVTSEGSRR